MEWGTTDRPAEHIESFFGVELHKKIQEEITGLDSTENLLRELADDILALKETDDPETFNALLMNCKATAENCANNLAEKKSFFAFYLGDTGNINQIILERDLNMSLCRILKWNKFDARELGQWVKELKKLGESSGFHLRDLIKAGQIPSENIPEGILRYPTWAMDRRGYCLAGTEMDEVIHVDEIIEEMEERRK